MNLLNLYTGALNWCSAIHFLGRKKKFPAGMGNTVRSRERTTKIIRGECERRLVIIESGVDCAIRALKLGKPQLAEMYLDDVVRYGQLAKLDVQELHRRETVV